VAPHRLRLGLLDFGDLLPGVSPKETVHNSIRAAILAEQLGYSRYWAGEHHSLADAWGCPEIVLALLAANTKTIRIGTGAILLPIHSPFRIAEDFSLLENLFPGRIDLGVGRGSPAFPPNIPPLVDGKPEISHKDKLSLLCMLLLNALPADHPYFGARAIPTPAKAPEVWLLAATFQGAMLAAALGLPLGLSIFHVGSKDEPELIGAYRRAFKPSRLAEKPKWLVAVAGTCCASEAEAAAAIAQHDNPWFVPKVCGSPQHCKEKFWDFARRYQTEEIMFYDVAKQAADREKSCKLLAHELNLSHGDAN